MRPCLPVLLKKSICLLHSSKLLTTHYRHLIRMASTSLLKDKAFVDGEWIPSKDGTSFKVTNPANNKVVGTVPDMGAADVEAAIQIAYRTFQTWKKTTAKERSDKLKKLHALILENKEELAKILTLENGKPLAESRGEVMYGAAFVEWFAEEGRRVQGSVISHPAPSKRMIVMKQPIGVCGMITPWNFPNAMITRKACAALAAGCTVVLKPAEDTPLSALALCELVEKAGFPPGVLNIVTSDRPNAASVGKALCESPLVSLISFTGSSAVGKILLRQSASTVKKCAMELGGNAPFIVFDSADVDTAVTGAMASKFRCTGQTCVCANRFLVQEGIYDAFVAKFAETINKQLKVGDGMTDGITQGPMINEKAVEKVDRFVQDAIALGAKTLVGGKRSDVGKTFYEPTLLTDVTGDMLCVKDEIFGPVASIMKFKTEEEALIIANGVSAGLAAYIFSKDMNQLWRMTEGLEYGMVGVNDGLFSCCEGPFGGYKESGLGREGGIGIGIEEYLEIKYMCLGGM